MGQRGHTWNCHEQIISWHPRSVSCLRISMKSNPCQIPTAKCTCQKYLRSRLTAVENEKTHKDQKDRTLRSTPESLWNPKICYSYQQQKNARNQTVREHNGEWTIEDIGDDYLCQDSYKPYKRRRLDHMTNGALRSSRVNLTLIDLVCERWKHSNEGSGNGVPVTINIDNAWRGKCQRGSSDEQRITHLVSKTSAQELRSSARRESIADRDAARTSPTTTSSGRTRPLDLCKSL